ncbi:exosome complex exonuclease Rrp41, partial [archaeon]|nr:exosome complex exonuclease Rrp41 [archaeon]
DAGLSMKGLVSAVAVGKVGDKIVADLNYDEEAFEGGSSDIPVAMIQSTGEITLLQLDGEVSKEDLKEALEMARKACKKIYELQKKALKEKYHE